MLLTLFLHKFVNINMNINGITMKKVIFVLLAVCALSSCAKPDKCKCSIEINSSIIDVEIKDQIIERPEGINCSQIKVENLKGDIVSIDLSKIGTIRCVDHND